MEWASGVSLHGSWLKSIQSVITKLARYCGYCVVPENFGPNVVRSEWIVGITGQYLGRLIHDAVNVFVNGRIIQSVDYRWVRLAAVRRDLLASTDKVRATMFEAPL